MKKTSHAVPSARIRRLFPLALLAFSMLACGRPEMPQEARRNGDWKAFEGTLNAAGYRQALRLGPDRMGSIFSLSGPLMLVGERKLGKGFQCRIIGFNDNTKGIDGVSTWTDARGDKVFSEIQGEPLGAGNRIRGTIVGGSGRYAGVSGEYSFAWSLVVGDGSRDETDFQGRAEGLRGRFRMSAAGSSPPAENPGAPESGRIRP